MDEDMNSEVEKMRAHNMITKEEDPRNISVITMDIGNPFDGNSRH